MNPIHKKIAPSLQILIYTLSILISLTEIKANSSPTHISNSKMQSLLEDKSITTLKTAYQTILSHLHRNDITPGVVIASPSMNQPNYFYHWIRDAGLTMMEIVTLYQQPLPPDKLQLLDSAIKAWINFEIQNQNTAVRQSNLGEPIFTVKGEIYPAPWGRPQNDGPAIRAITMTMYAFELIKQKRFEEVKRLYRSEMPATSPIKRDLEYVSEHWRDSNFDLWEEVKGDHFFTKMAQRTALILGSKLASITNDPFASSYYANKAKEIESSITKHINNHRKILVPTLNPIGGWKGKDSELDSSTILAVLYFSMGDGFINVNDAIVANTAMALESVFSKIYQINIHTNRTYNLAPLSPGIGRYPEDVYNGSGFTEGNPWFITTNAFAEYYCRLANSNPKSTQASALRAKGISFINRVLLHSDVNGQMSEQFNRNSGYMQGAHDLTWSYVSYLRAFRTCQTNAQFSKFISSLMKSRHH